MQMIIRLSRDKGVVDEAGFVNTITRVQGVTKGPAHPSARPAMPEVGIPYYLVPPLVNAIPKTYLSPPAPMPSGGVYTYPYMPSLVI